MRRLGPKCEDCDGDGYNIDVDDIDISGFCYRKICPKCEGSGNDYSRWSDSTIAKLVMLMQQTGRGW